MAVTQYIGARYVPMFADPVEWSSTKQYEPLTIVLHEGDSYTSRQFVPVGAAITNTDFWVKTGNYNAQIEQYRQEVDSYHDDVIEVIDTFQKTILSYDAVSSMLADMTLNVGQTCVTDGYYSANDGGGATYLIVESGTTDYANLELSNGLKATLVPDVEINFRQLGAIPSSSFDCKEILEWFAHDSQLKTHILFIPSGVWYFSPTSLRSTDGVTIHGEYSWDIYDTQNGTIICNYDPSQEYIWRCGGNGSISSPMIWGDRIANSRLENLSFTTNMIDSECVALVITMSFYSSYDRLAFRGVTGRAIYMTNSWENFLGTLVVRSCSGLLSKIYIAPTAPISGITVSANISSNDFYFIHAEAFSGTLFEIPKGVPFNNNHIGTIMLEGGGVNGQFTSETYDSERAESAVKIPVLVLSGYNNTIDNIVSAAPSVRNAIYVRESIDYIVSTLIQLNVSGSGSQAIANWIINTINVHLPSRDFCLYESSSFQTLNNFSSVITIGTVTLTSQYTFNKLIDVNDGILPCINSINSRAYLGFDPNLFKPNTLCKRGTTVVQDSFLYPVHCSAGVSGSRSRNFGVLYVNSNNNVEVVTYNNSTSAHNLQVQVYTDGSSSAITTLTLSTAAGISYRIIDLSQFTTSPNLLLSFMSDSAAMGVVSANHILRV